MDALDGWKPIRPAGVYDLLEPSRRLAQPGDRQALNRRGTAIRDHPEVLADRMRNPCFDTTS
uniref:ID247 n=1 Tax=Bradyrhizobium japonicum TaxID=375 RepID=Q9ANG0_BRAJP|nr:ID247 [Bradyrhizobium japonicum]